MRRLDPSALIEAAKVIILLQLEIVVLEVLRVAGERGRTVSRPHAAELSRLADEGYVKIRRGTTKGTLFVIIRAVG